MLFLFIYLFKLLSNCLYQWNYLQLLELTVNAYSCLQTQIYNCLAQYKGYQCELCAQCSHIIKIHWLPLSEIQNVHCFGKHNVVRRSLVPLSGGLCLDCSLAWAINGTDQWFWSVILADGCQTAREGGTKGEICHYHHLVLLYEYFFLPWKRHPTRADNIKHMLCHICDYRETIIEDKL